MALWFTFQSPLFPSRPLSWPLWGPPTCGYNSTPTPSMGTGPLWPGRWNTARPVGAGATGSRWTPQATRSGIWTPTRSMRSVCSSPGPGRAAPAPLGPPSGPGPSVPVSLGTLGPLVHVWWGLTCSLSAGGSHFPQLFWDPVWAYRRSLHLRAATCGFRPQGFVSLRTSPPPFSLSLIDTFLRVSPSSYGNHPTVDTNCPL